jgi:hypothetical protein
VQEGVLFYALAYIVYIRETCYFSLACTSKKINKKHEIQVDVQKAPQGIEKKLDNRRVSFIQFINWVLGIFKL